MDTKQLLTILEKFSESGIEELRYKEEGSEIVLKKSQKVVVSAGAPAMAAMAPSAVAPAAGTGTPSEPAIAATPVAGGETIKSPIVGSFYRSPAPDAPAFVEEGRKVRKGDTLCIIEAMKVMNQLEAEFDCEIVKVLVDNGAMVEFDTPLFEVRKV